MMDSSHIVKELKKKKRRQSGQIRKRSRKITGKHKITKSKAAKKKRILRGGDITIRLQMIFG
jgi:hypothetical protein